MTMDYLVLALRVIIVLVLLISGFAKLADREGSAEAMIGFGVPARLIPLTTFALPILEIALAIGLAFAATAGWAAVATTLLFVAFTLGVGRIVLAGENVDCHCFGQLSTGPVSWLTLARNIVLTGAAVIIAWWTWSREATSIWEDVDREAFIITALTLVIVALGGVILRLWQTQAELLEQIDELQKMIPAARSRKLPTEESFARVTEGLALLNAAGESVPATALMQPKAPALLVFVSSSCRACSALMPEIAGWQEEFTPVMPISVVGIGETSEIRKRASDAGIDQVYMRETDELATRLKVKGNPAAVLVDHDGYVRAKPMLGGVGIRRGIEELRRQVGG